jgi:tetratricopeptide (TPR) repeat protein
MAKISNLLACAALALALAAPGAASAAPKQEARVHIDRATKAHKAGNLEKALTELQAAYAIDPQPQLLYAIGQIYTKLGRCSEASDAYLRFLASGTDASTAQVVKQAIDACKGQGAAEPAPTPAATEPTPPPTPATTKPAASQSDDEDPLSKRSAAKSHERPAPAPAAKAAPPAKAAPRKRVAFGREQPAPPPESDSDVAAKPWYRDFVGDVLVVGGVTSLVLGGLAYRAARTDLDTAETVSTHQRYQELVDAAQTKRLVGVALLGGGAVLITAGVLRFMLRDNHTEVRRVGMAPARGGGLLTWTRSF